MKNKPAGKQKTMPKTNLASKKCEFINCRNTREIYGGTFFRFPKQQSLQQEWIRTCGNPFLGLVNPSKLRQKLICDMHFPENIFKSASKRYLVKGALPEKRQLSKEVPTTSSKPVFESISQETRLNQTLDSDSDEPARTDDGLPPTRDYETPGKKKLRNIISRQKILSNNLRARKDRLKNKLILSSSYKNRNVRTFCAMQNNYKKQLWSLHQKNLSLSMYFRGPALYQHMRSNLHFNLPGQCTIRNWLKLHHLSAGLSQNIMHLCKLKAASMEDSEKQCVLLFDEMQIKKHLEYNSTLDLIEGFEDLGEPLGRRAKIASHASVFMIRGLLNTWKIPIQYVYTFGPITANDLSVLISELLTKLKSTGLIVKAVVCDQSFNNRRLFKRLRGRNKNYAIFNNDKIYLIHDIPHVVKSIINNFMNKENNILINDKQISWGDVENLYRLDKGEARASVNSSENIFDVMRAKFATQVFSNKVSAAILTCIQTKQITSTTAYHTAEFIKVMNDLFDILNSKSVVDSNPLRCALSEKRGYLLKNLTTALEWTSNIHVKKYSGKVRKDIFCFEDLNMSISCIISLYQDLSQEGYSYILTSRLNLDPLENLFAKIRGMGGSNTNPTARIFRINLQRNICTDLEKPPESANCEIYDDIDESVTDQIESKEANTSPNDTDIPSNISLEDNETKVPLEECSITYLAGYIVNIMRKKHKCESCKKDLLSFSNLKDDSQYLILKRDYGYNPDIIINTLKVPQRIVVEVAKIVLKVFDDVYSQHSHEKVILTKIRMKSLIAVKESKLRWFDVQSEECISHREFFINHLTKVKLLKTIK